jgi:hypothetical protein
LLAKETGWGPADLFDLDWEEIQFWVKEVRAFQKDRAKAEKQAKATKNARRPR